MAGLHLLTLVAGQALVAGLYLATFLALGIPLLRSWATFDSHAERVAITLGTGLAAFLLVALVLALTGMLSLACLALVAAVAIARSRRDLRVLVHTVRVAWPTVFFTAAAALPIFLLTLYPPIEWDELMYHLPLAELHATTHHLSIDPEIRYASFPQAFELLLASALLLGTPLPQIATFVTMIVTMGVLASATIRIASREASWAAVALWLSSPLVLWLGSIGYVEAGLSCMAMLLVYATLRWREEGERHWLDLASLFAGSAAAIKVSGLIFIGLPILLVLRSREWRWVARAATIIVASCGLYYARSVFLTGSPVYPLLPGVFGFARGPWDAFDVASHDASLRSYGVPASIGNFVALPWYLVFSPDKFLGNVGISPWFLLVVPCLLTALIFRPRLRLVCIAVVTYLGLWFLTVQEYRGVAPILPVVAFVSASVLDGATRALQEQASARARTRWGIAVAVALLLPGWRFVWGALEEKRIPPTSSAARWEFVAARLPGEVGLRAVERSSGGEFRIFALFGENLKYLGHGHVCGDWFGPCRFRDVLSRLSSTAELWRYLREHRFTHLLIDKPRLSGLQGTAFSLPPDFPAGFDLVHEDSKTVVYGVRSRCTCAD